LYLNSSLDDASMNTDDNSNMSNTKDTSNSDTFNSSEINVDFTEENLNNNTNSTSDIPNF